MTGARDAVADTAAPLVRRMRSRSVAAGRARLRHRRVPSTCAEVWAFADAAVVGSAIVQVVAASSADGGDPGAEVEKFVRWLTGR